MKILMIDDQAGITTVVGLVAAELGIEFKALNNSRDSAAVFGHYRPDIILLDMIMPEKDGIDVLNEIFLTGIPTLIAMTTGYGESYLRLAQGVATFHGYMQTIPVLKKPFRREDVVELLRGLGDQSRFAAGDSPEPPFGVAQLPGVPKATAVC